MQFDGFMKVGIIALIVVFQPEIRKFLLMVGSLNFYCAMKRFIVHIIRQDTDIGVVNQRAFITV